jgi:hypothetical protein
MRKLRLSKFRLLSRIINLIFITITNIQSMKKLIYVSALVLSTVALSSFTTKSDTVVVADRVSLGTADDRVSLGTADDRVSLGTADDRVSLGTADARKETQQANDRVSLGTAD